MRRLAVALAIGLAAVVAFLAIGFALLPREALKTRIAEQISAWTGRDVSLRGEPEISFLPRLAVTLRDVEIGGPPDMPESILLSTDELTGTIRLLPLIIGRVEVQRFRMVRPRIHLVRSAGGTRNWALDSGAAALQLAFAGDVPLGEFILEDGSLTYEDLATGRQESAQGIGIAVDWSSIRQPFALSGAATWRGQPLRLSVRAEDPFAFLKRDPTPFEASLQAAAMQIAFTGEASREDEVRLSGRITLDSPSLQEFATWTGYPLGDALPGPMELAGNAVFAGSTLTVDQLELDLNGQRATGALSFALGSLPALSGTLAFAALDLTPYVPAALHTSGLEGWRQVSLATDWFRQFEVDLRMSASSVSVGALGFGATAATASLRDGVLGLGIGEAVLGGGSISGDVTVTDDPGAGGSAAQAQLRATGIALADLAGPLGFGPSLAGTATLTTDLQSRGTTAGAHFSSLTGTTALRVTDGAIPDPGLTVLALPEPQAAVPAAAEGASAPFSELTADLLFADHRAEVRSATVLTPFWTAHLSGGIGLLDGSLALTGELRPVTSGTPAPARPVVVEGGITNAVARTGAAAAPL